MKPSFSPTVFSSFVLSPLFLAAVALSPVARAQGAFQPPAAQPARNHTSYQTPLRFEPNRGQAEAHTQFVAHGAGYSLLLNATNATFNLHRSAAHGRAVTGKPAVAESSDVIRMHLLGADDQAAMTPERALPGYVNYFSGSDASKFKTGIPTFAAARARQVYPGIDVVYYGNQRQLEYDFVVAPGASPDAIHFALSGAAPKLSANGELALRVKGGTGLSFRKPVLYQEANGRRVPVDGSFMLAANGTVGFKVGAYDPTRALTIDPIISYASYFGGSLEDEINGTTINSANQLYAVGQTRSFDLPASAGELQSANIPNKNSNYRSAFVTKFSADGSTVLWTTYLAGSQDDFASSVAVNASDQAYVVGGTASCKPPNTSEIGFPFTADAVQALCNPNVIGFNNYESSSDGYDAFLAKLSSDGKTLLYATPLGGTNNDFAQSVVLDAAGKVYLVGETFSTQYQSFVSQRNNSDVPSYPVNNHGQAAIGTANYPTTANAFYSNTTESQQYASTDSSGNVYGPDDEQAFLTVLSADLHSLVYSSLLGGGILGGCGNGACNTNGYAVAVNGNGIVYVGGNTSSAHWPVTANAFAPTCSNAGQTRSQCPMTGWAAAFDPTKSGAASLLFTTYITGTSAGMNGTTPLYPGSDVFGMTTDSTGNVILTGDTNANNFPTTSGVLQPACMQHGDGNADTGVCNFDAFVTKLTPTGATVWSTYYQGNVGSYATLQGQGVAVDANSNVYVLMQGNAPGLPLMHSLSSNGAQSTDAYLAEFTQDGKTALLGTYLGSGGGIAVNSNSLHLDSNLNAYFGGSQGYNTYGGTFFPTTANAPGPALQGNADGYVVKLITQQQPSAAALAVSPTGTVTSTQTVTLTATITSASTLSGIPTRPSGTVTFMNGSTALGTPQTVNAAGVATFAGTYPNGSYSFTAVYSGDAGFNGSTSTATPLTVSSAVATTTTATVAPASASFGQSVVLTSTTLAGTTPATGGTVTFLAGSVTLGTATVGANGLATVTVTPAPGTYSVVASYAGTASAANPTGFGGSASAGSPLTVAKGTAAVAFTATPALVATGGTVMLKATVSTTATGTAPSGMVNFLDGAAVIGSGTLTAGVATLNTAALTGGTHVLSAAYAGDTNYSSATSPSTVTVTVRGAAGTTTVLQSSSLAVSKGATVTLMATIGSTATNGSPTGTVTFLDGTTTLGTGAVTSGTASFTTGALTSGTHSFTATYGGDTLFLMSTSTPVAVAVANPMLSLTANPNPLVIPRGQTGMTTLTLTPSGGYTGMVSFSCVNLPAFVTCAFNPTTLTFTAASGPMTDVLTVATSSKQAMLSAPHLFGQSGGTQLAMILWLPGSALALFGLKRKGLAQPLRRMLLLSVLVFGLGGMAMLSGCGGAGTFNTAAAGTTQVQVTLTAADGSQITTPLTLTIQ